MSNDYEQQRQPAPSGASIIDLIKLPDGGSVGVMGDLSQYETLEARRSAAEKNLATMKAGFDSIGRDMEAYIKRDRTILYYLKGTFSPDEEAGETRGENLKGLAYRALKSVPLLYPIAKRTMGLEERPIHLQLNDILDITKSWELQLREYLYGDSGLVKSIAELNQDLRTLEGQAVKLSGDKDRLQPEVESLEAEHRRVDSEYQTTYGQVADANLPTAAFKLRQRRLEIETDLQDKKLAYSRIEQELLDVCDLISGDRVIRDNMVIYHAVGQRVADKVRKGTERKEGSIRLLGELTKAPQLIHKVAESAGKLTEYYNRVLAQVSQNSAGIVRDAEESVPRLLNRPEVIQKARSDLAQGASELLGKDGHREQLSRLADLLETESKRLGRGEVRKLGE